MVQPGSQEWWWLQSVWSPGTAQSRSCPRWLVRDFHLVILCNKVSWCTTQTSHRKSHIPPQLEEQPLTRRNLSADILTIISMFNQNLKNWLALGCHQKWAKHQKWPHSEVIVLQQHLFTKGSCEGCYFSFWITVTAANCLNIGPRVDPSVLSITTWNSWRLQKICFTGIDKIFVLAKQNLFGQSFRWRILFRISYFHPINRP